MRQIASIFISFALIIAGVASSSAARVDIDDYVQEGLIGHWDAIENAGRGIHDANSTTWKDLTGNHADMTFPNGTLIGDNYYDMKKEGVEGGTGGYLTDVADIATAFSNMACTVEIVCDFRSQADEGTVFCCYETYASRRLLWVTSNTGTVAGANGCIGALNYLSTNGLDHRDWCTVDKGVFNVSRTYTIKCGSSNAKIYKNGLYTGLSMLPHGLSNFDVNKAWVCIGRRYAAESPSAGVADMKIHAIRIYNRVLTDQEVSINAAVDVTRFFNTDSKLYNTYEYEQNGLIAHWDGIENAGRGKHDNSATTWTDLVGGKKFQFDNGANVGDTYFDMLHADKTSAGGYVKDVASLAQAIADKNATIEIVYDFRTLKNNGTLIAFCDGDNRVFWARSHGNVQEAKGCVAVLEYLRPGFTNDGLLNIDPDLLYRVRTYGFVCSSTACNVYRNGESLSSSVPIGSRQPNVNNTWLSIGRKYSSSGVLAADVDAKIYAIRIYNRQLTAEEQQANAFLDRKRFVEERYKLASKSGTVVIVR